jgi:hypothetical protein
VLNALINFRRFDETFSVPMDLYSGSPLYDTYSMLFRENISKSMRRHPRSKTSLSVSLLAKRPLIALLYDDLTMNSRMGSSKYFWECRL